MVFNVSKCEDQWELLIYDIEPATIRTLGFPRRNVSFASKETNVSYRPGKAL